MFLERFAIGACIVIAIAESEFGDAQVGPGDKKHARPLHFYSCDELFDGFLVIFAEQAMEMVFGHIGIAC